MRLENKVAIITGAAQGIGKGTAKRFLKEGAKIAIWDINAELGRKVAKELDPSGEKVKFYQVNTVDFEATQKAAQKVVDDFGQIDILINNAGITRDATLKKMTTEQFQQVLNVNLTGVFNGTKAVYPFMAEREYGRIISASSVVALYGNFGQSNYSATKAGLIGMTKTWAKELGRKKITVNAVAPGFINTDMMKTIPEKVLDMFNSKTPLARLGEIEEVANVYLFLASDEASFVTGTVVSVDGGITL